MGDGNDHESESDDTNEGAVPRSHSIIMNPGDLGLSEGSTGKVGGACPHCSVHMPAWFMQGKL